MADGVVGNTWTVGAVFGPGTKIVSIVNGVMTTSGTPVDPAGAITFTVTDPLGVSTPNTISKNGSGAYTLNVYCPTPGFWECVIVAANPGAGSGADKATWTVAPT